MEIIIKVSIFSDFDCDCIFVMVSINSNLLSEKCDWTGSLDEETWDCCTVDKPCQENEGDCDNDNECAGNLVCGTNNCGGIFDSAADCCIRKIIFILFLLNFSLDFILIFAL